MSSLPLEGTLEGGGLGWGSRTSFARSPTPIPTLYAGGRSYEAKIDRGGFDMTTRRGPLLASLVLFSTALVFCAFPAAAQIEVKLGHHVLHDLYVIASLIQILLPLFFQLIIHHATERRRIDFDPPSSVSSAWYKSSSSCFSFIVLPPGSLICIRLASSFQAITGPVCLW